MNFPTDSRRRPGRIALSPELTIQLLHVHETEAGGVPRDLLATQVRVGRLPVPVLEALKTPDLDVVTSVSILLKILTKHAVAPAIVAAMPETVLQPVAVYHSASKTHVARAVVVLSGVLVHDQPFMASIELDRPNVAGLANMHWMTSAYPKANELKFAQWEADGLLIWAA
ncbi:hypothetical protein [Burkholderia gladioli]|uniref:MuF-C-terminal domain-containing protein n=1 Tax=Burkholderia gladioli TaxID=28095 RepID=UPI0034DB2935